MTTTTAPTDPTDQELEELGLSFEWTSQGLYVTADPALWTEEQREQLYERLREAWPTILSQVLGGAA